MANDKFHFTFINVLFLVGWAGIFIYSLTYLDKRILFVVNGILIYAVRYYIKNKYGGMMSMIPITKWDLIKWMNVTVQRIYRDINKVNKNGYKIEQHDFFYRLEYTAKGKKHYQMISKAEPCDTYDNKRVFLVTGTGQKIEITQFPGTMYQIFFTKDQVKGIETIDLNTKEKKFIRYDTKFIKYDTKFINTKPLDDLNNTLPPETLENSKQKTKTLPLPLSVLDKTVGHKLTIEDVE